MLFSDPYKYLYEEAEDEYESSADQMFDSDEVKDMAEELNDQLDDIPYAKGEVEISNGGIPDASSEEESKVVPEIPFTAEMCTMIRTESTSLRTFKTKFRYYIEMSNLFRYMKGRGYDPSDAAIALHEVEMANGGEEGGGSYEDGFQDGIDAARSAVENVDAVPSATAVPSGQDPGEVTTSGTEAPSADNVSVAVPGSELSAASECAIMEAEAGFEGLATAKLRAYTEAIRSLKLAGYSIVKTR